MLFKKLTPMIPNQTLTDPEADYRSAAKIGSYRLSAQALYQPNGDYLLRSSIAEAVSSTGSAHVTGCCAGSVPVARVLVTTTDGRRLPLLCDSESAAARLADALMTI